MRDKLKVLSRRFALVLQVRGVLRIWELGTDMV